MIAVHEIVIGQVYKVQGNEWMEDNGVLLVPVSCMKDRGFYTFRFLWLDGESEGQTVEGSVVAFNLMMPFVLYEP